MYKLARIKNWSQVDRKAETVDCPQIWYLSPRMDGGGYDQYQVSQTNGWDAVIRRINFQVKKCYSRLYTPTFGLRPDGAKSGGWDGKYPFNLRTGTFGGNAVWAEAVGNGWVQVKTFVYDNRPAVGNYFTDACMFHKATIATRSGRVNKPGSGFSGLNVYLPLVSRNNGYAFMPENIIEWFPELPSSVTVIWGSGLNCRVYPGVASAKAEAFTGVPFVYQYRRPVGITDYALIGSEVWGRTTEGWIALYYPQYKQPYSTSWRMETQPPPL
jgi:hypothetical protein